MAIKTTAEQLEEVQAAITQALSSQQLSSGSESVSRPDLATLYAQEDRLLKRLAAEQSKGFAFSTGLVRGHD